MSERIDVEACVEDAMKIIQRAAERMSREQYYEFITSLMDEIGILASAAAEDISKNGGM